MVYLVIGEPLANGATHPTTTFEPWIIVVGAATAYGASAAKIATVIE